MVRRARRLPGLASLLLAATVASACSFAPPYRVPASPAVAAFGESGPWQAARAADAVPRGAWWRVYDDAELDRLEQRIETANPDLAAALARYDQASAGLQQARSGLFPWVGAGVQSDRMRQSAYRPLRGSAQPDDYNSDTLGLSVGYELDVWGRVRNEVSAGRSAMQASAAQLAVTKLSLQATLANAYFSARELDQQQQVLQDTRQAYRRALTLTQSRHAAGAASDIDVSRAQGQLDAADAALSEAVARRARYAHAIAVLVGLPPSAYRLAPLAPAQPADRIPNIPAGVPATLLQRRPDIAAAERAVAQANAQIGVTRAAFYPDISLDLDGGFQSDHAFNWLSAPASFWTLGPTLALQLFDGGRRQALEDKAQARLDEQGARYRAVVLDAFQQVEDALADLHYLSAAADSQARVLHAAQRTLHLAMTRYRDGAISYLDVVVAQTTELQAQQQALALHTRRLAASVALIRALGGGWQTPRYPGA